jgi:hypothetical protein
MLTASCSVGVGGLQASDDDASGPNVLPSFDAGGLDATTTAHHGGQAPPVDAGMAQTDDDAGSEAGALGEPPEASTTGRTPFDASACDDASGPCVVVPGGWTLVAFAPNQASSCPAGFASAPSVDVVEGPSAAAACTCGACTVTSTVSCAAGSVAGYNDYKSTAAAGSCASVDMPSPLANDPPGSCGTDIYQGDYSIYDVMYDAPPPSGGTCSAPGVAHNAAVTYTAHDRTCAPDSPQAANCTGDICRPMLPPTYGACIAAPGAQACPQGPLGVQHFVGTSAAFTCADCGCAITATCSGTITLFTDTGCTKGANAISSNVCVPITAKAATYKAYEYVGGTAQNVACQAAGPGSAQDVTLTGEETLCCAQ